jgi:hypothetical protein
MVKLDATQGPTPRPPRVKRKRPVHRSMASLPLLLGRVFTGVLLALAFMGLLAWLRPWVADAWMAQFQWWMSALDIPMTATVQMGAALPMWLLPVASFELHVPDTDPLTPWMHGLGAVAVWWASARLPDAARPGGYLLRFAVVLHACAIAYFLFWPNSFPHSLYDHTVGGFRQFWVLMLLTPWLHLLIYYLLPFVWWCRIGLTTITLIYLGLLTPLLFAAHAALIHLLGLIVMPLLALLGGLMVAIIGIVALYGWGMSWPTLVAEEA